jgi:hypothetical protein
MSDRLDRRPLWEIFTAISRDLFLLVSQLASIAKAELGSAVSGVRNGVFVATAGAVLLLFGGLTLVAALVLIAVALGLPAWAGALAVGIVLVLGGGAAIQVGVGSVRRVQLEFPETRGAVTESVQWLKTLQR